MRNKDQGTAWVRDIEALAEACGLKCWRLAEQGSNDLGDLVVVTPQGEHFIVEAKCRGNLPVHQAVEKARCKAKHPTSAFTPTGTLVAWKRLVATEGVRRRQPGRPVAILDLEELFEWWASRG